MKHELKCEVCRKGAERLYMRNLDGKWVCAPCIPAKELDSYPGLRELLGLGRTRRAASRRKAA
jgi:hypothetical protein